MKKVITFILASLMFVSLFTIPVQATTINNGDWVVEDEHGNVITATPDNNTAVENDPLWSGDTDKAAATTQERTDSVNNGPQYGSMAENKNQSGTGAVEAPVNPNTETKGEGMVVLTLDKAVNPGLDVLIQLYNRSNGKIIDVPCYKANDLVSKQSVPAGSYVVYNVIVDSDSATNPRWVYKIGDIVEVPDGDTVYFTIKLLKSPNGEVNITDDKPATQPSGEVTDTNINTPEKTGFAKVGEMLKGFFSGFNFILIIVFIGAIVGYIIIKKKKEED